ncbi:MAG TPA: hypothetical protein VLX09_01090 [Stellaceae bacterium]|nr:hypothetical protein [Stellaceae bacterium]
MTIAKPLDGVARLATAVLFAVGVGVAMLGSAHAGEWHNGQWGHWGWNHGVRVFIVEPYPYGYYAPPPVVYAPPPPPPPAVYYAPPPVVVGPSFGVFVGVH